MGDTAAEVREAVELLYRAIVDKDIAAAGTHLREDAFVAVPGHEGSGPDHLAGLLEALHAGGFRTWATDSADVLASEFHGVVLDRWLRTGGNAGLDEHITVMAADRGEDGRFGIVSIYGYDGAAISRFFSAD